MNKQVRKVGRTAGFVGLTAAMLPGMLGHVAASSDDRRELIRDRWTRKWAKTLLSLFGIEVVIDGNVPPSTLGSGRGRLVVSNHRSALDIGIILSNFGGTMVSRGDLAKWPLLGAAARSVGTVFVNRGNAESGAATMRSIQRELESGRTIGIFPEGTTFDGDEVRPFHAGAFVSAVRAEAEIVPIGVAYPKTSAAAFFNETFLSHLDRLSKGDPTRMVVCVGEPFVVRRGMKAREVTDRTYEAVKALVGRARERCGP